MYARRRGSKYHVSLSHYLNQHGNFGNTPHLFKTPSPPGFRLKLLGGWGAAGWLDIPPETGIFKKKIDFLTLHFFSSGGLYFLLYFLQSVECVLQR